jgi:hypothetical protein
MKFNRILNLVYAFTLMMSHSTMTIVAAGWSVPQEVIFPQTPPFNATLPFIATDGNGNSIAVWYDVSDNSSLNGSLLGAILTSGAVNSQGQPDWVLTAPIAANVKLPGNYTAQAVGMDSNGNALAAWTDNNNNIYVSRLLASQATWTPPTIINTPLEGEVTEAPYVAVAANGNAIILWTSSPLPYQSHLLANVFDPQTDQWIGQLELLEGALEMDLSIYQIAMDDNGNAAILINNLPNNFKTIFYNSAANQWTTIPPITEAFFVGASITLDPAGNATVAWIEFDNGIMKAATLPFNQTAFTDPITLSSTATVFSSFPAIKADSYGNVITVWPDAAGDLSSARYSFDSGTWSILPSLSLGENKPSSFILSVDAEGNAVSTWTHFLNPSSYVQAAALSASDTAWQLLTELSPASDSCQNSQGVVTAKGDAVVIWEDDINSTLGKVGTINSSIYLGLFPAISLPLPSSNPVEPSSSTPLSPNKPAEPSPSTPSPAENPLNQPPSIPLPPTAFAGEVVKNKFATQTDRIHSLTWNASQDPTVVAYKLYRNSVLIAAINATGPSFSYEDHNRHKKVADTYALTSVNSDGIESDPLTLILQ